MPIPVLRAFAVTRRFGAALAVDGVDLEVRAGERIALAGHNGAGKSTLMKLALGLVRPSGGRIEIAGGPPGTPEARELAAYLPESVAFHPALTGREQMRHFARLRGRSSKDADRLLERVGLGEAANRRIGTYSKGMRQRVGLAQALIGAPRLMLLDEPTGGLDPVSRRDLQDLLEGLAERGTAILMSSHSLSELESRVDRVAVMANGRKVAEGSLPELRARAALPVEIRVRPRDGERAALEAAFPEARNRHGELVFTCPDSGKIDLLGRLASSASAIEDFDIRPPSLEDVYVAMSAARNGSREAIAG